MTSLILDEAREKMQRAVGHTRADFGSIRTGRAGRSTRSPARARS